MGDPVTDSPSSKLVGVLHASCVDEWTTGLVQASLPIRISRSSCSWRANACTRGQRAQGR